MLKNLVKFSNYLFNLWTNISGIKWTVYQPKTFGIRSLFILFHLDDHRIVHAWLNIAVTYSPPFSSCQSVIRSKVTASKRRMTCACSFPFPALMNPSMSGFISTFSSAASRRHETDGCGVEISRRESPGGSRRYKPFFSSSLTAAKIKLECLSRVGNCDKFYFTFEFEVQMWVWIFKRFEKDWIHYSLFIEQVKSEYP